MCLFCIVYFLLVYIFLFFLAMCYAACGILVPHQGLNPCPLQWKHWVLTTVPSVKSHIGIYFILQNIFECHERVCCLFYLSALVYIWLPRKVQKDISHSIILWLLVVFLMTFCDTRSLILEVESRIIKWLLFVQTKGCRYTRKFKKISGNSTVHIVVGGNQRQMTPFDQTYHQNGLTWVQSSCINNIEIALGPHWSSHLQIYLWESLSVDTCLYLKSKENISD